MDVDCTDCKKLMHLTLAAFERLTEMKVDGHYCWACWRVLPEETKARIVAEAEESRRQLRMKDDEQ